MVRHATRLDVYYDCHASRDVGKILVVMKRMEICKKIINEWDVNMNSLTVLRFGFELTVSSRLSLSTDFDPSFPFVLASLTPVLLFGFIVGDRH